MPELFCGTGINGLEAVRRCERVLSPRRIVRRRAGAAGGRSPGPKTERHRPGLPDAREQRHDVYLSGYVRYGDTLRRVMNPSPEGTDMPTSRRTERSRVGIGEAVPWWRVGLAIGLSILMLTSTVAATGVAGATAGGDVPRPSHAAETVDTGQSSHAAETVDTGQSSHATDTVTAGRPSVGAGPSPAASSNHETILTGQVRYQNRSGGLEPARQVLIRIRKDIAGPVNPKIAQTTTNETGHWEVKLDVADRESNVDGDDVLHLRIQAIAQNPAVKVVRFGQNAGTANGRKYTLDRAGQVTRGQATATFDQTATSKRYRRVFRVANWSLEARRYADGEMGWTRKRVKVKFPAANDDNNQYKSPFNKIVVGGNDSQWDGTKNYTVYHEYGHAVMGGLFGYKGWQIPKYKGSHCIWSETGRITAWYEGFAAFYEAAVNDDPDTDGLALETRRYYNRSRSTKLDCPDADSGDGFDGAAYEGAVGNILWDLYDPANEPHDEVDGDLATIFDAVDEKDNRAWGRIANNGRTRDVHDFYIQYVDNTGNRNAIRKIYEEYGILKPDRFEHDPSPGSTGFACSRRLRQVDEVPCRFFTADKWSTLPTNRSVEAGLHAVDTDYYEVSLKEEQRVTVNVTSSPGTGNLTLYATRSKVNGSQPGTQGRRVRNGPHETLTFTAKDDGTYYIRVAPRSLQDLAVGTYAINVSAAPQPPQTYEQNDDTSTAHALSLIEVGKTRNTTEITAGTARHDDDLYRIELGEGHRIEHAQLRNGPGLTLRLEDGTTVLQSANDGGVVSTTTALQGVYYLNVTGPVRETDYTLNVTTRLISQRYEENDRRSAATDLTRDLGFDTVPQAGSGKFGGTQWCTQQGGGQPGTGGGAGVQNPTSSFSGPCPRHNWLQEDRVAAGYSPAEGDWYGVSLRTDQRLTVNVSDERLGAELYHDGAKVADVPASGPGTTLTHVASSAGTYHVKVTGNEYVPLHRMGFQRASAHGQDRLEVNDDPATATSVTTAASGTHNETFELLKLAGPDEDYFATDLSSGDRLNATLTHRYTGSDVTLTVVRPDGSVLRATDLTRNVGAPEHRTYRKRAELTAQQTGTYHVLAAATRSAALTYNLTVQTSSTGVAGSTLLPDLRPDYFELERFGPGGAGPCKLCGIELPKLLFATEQVNVCVLDSEGFQSGVSNGAAPDDRCFNVEVSDGTIESVGPAKRDDASMYVAMDETTFDEIANAEDPRSTARTEFDRGDVRVEGVGLSNTVKIEAVKFTKGIFDTVNGLIDDF
jgi:hypothetical protein